MIARKLTGLAIAAVGATVIGTGAATAAVKAPTIDSISQAGVQGVLKVRHYHRGFRCFGRRHVLPRRAIRWRLRRQGYHRIRGLRYRPGRVFRAGGYRRRGPGSYVAFAKRFGHWGFYRLWVNACTGRAYRVRGPFRIRY